MTPLDFLQGVRVGPWQVVDDYCAARCIVGHDVQDIRFRVAFIEKTPRIRSAPFADPNSDFRNWTQGPKGQGGADGHLPENGLYGFYAPSREWCDVRLQSFGAVLTAPPALAAASAGQEGK